MHPLDSTLLHSCPPPLQAVNVTGPNGAPPEGAPRRQYDQVGAAACTAALFLQRRHTPTRASSHLCSQPLRFLLTSTALRTSALQGYGGQGGFGGGQAYGGGFGGGRGGGR